MCLCVCVCVSPIFKILNEPLCLNIIHLHTRIERKTDCTNRSPLQSHAFSTETLLDTLSLPFSHSFPFVLFLINQINSPPFALGAAMTADYAGVRIEASHQRRWESCLEKQGWGPSRVSYVITEIRRGESTGAVQNSPRDTRSGARERSLSRLAV